MMTDINAKHFSIIPFGTMAGTTKDYLIGSNQHASARYYSPTYPPPFLPPSFFTEVSVY
jgi:hypothetical protein